MRVETLNWDGADPEALAKRLRAAVPEPAAIAGEVAELVESVREGGDARVIELGAELDGVRVERLRVPAERAEAALGTIEPGLRDALEAAAANIRAVADAQPAAEPRTVEPGQGQAIELSEAPVAAAAIYAPGGRAPYPSTVLMGALAARSAGVGRVVLATPPSAPGEPPEAVLAAAAIAGVDEIYAMGGAQAIAALAYGTESIDPVDLIAGPGGPWVQEAKLAVSRTVGIDGYAGPSELVVVGDGSAPAEWLALDLCAQAEHGADGLLTLISTDADEAEAVSRRAAELGEAEPSVSDASLTAITAPDLEAAAALARALAPEHLQLACSEAEAVAATIATAGCIFTGPEGATAFGDYAAGSNHVLPTGGAGRFSGPLGPGTFRRTISVVRMNPAAAAELGPIVEEIARSEGFGVHGASARVRGATPEQEQD